MEVAEIIADQRRVAFEAKSEEVERTITTETDDTNKLQRVAETVKGGEGG